MDYTAPNEIKGWLECLFWFAGFIAALLYIAKSLRAPLPQPPNSQLSASHDELARRIGNLEAEGRTRSAGTYRKIDEIRTELKADIQTMDDKFDRKLESLPEKLINLLRNTGAINRH